MKKAILWQRKLSALVGTAVMMSIFAVSAAAFAEDTASPPYMAPSRIASAIIKEVIVQEKTPADILADQERFAVTPATVITMGDESVSLSEMPVPCKIRVYYEKRKNRDSEAVKIDILDFGADASTRWAEPLD